MDNALLNADVKNTVVKSERKRKYLTDSDEGDDDDDAPTLPQQQKQDNNKNGVAEKKQQRKQQKQQHAEKIKILTTLEHTNGAKCTHATHPSTEQFSLEDFCDEILYEIFQHLDTWTLLGLMNLNKRFHLLLLDSRFWHEIDLGKEPLPLGILEDILDRTNKKTSTIKLCGPSPSQLESEIRQFNKTLNDAFTMRCRHLLELELCSVTIDFRHIHIVDFPSTLKRLVLNNCNVCMPDCARNLFAGIDLHLRDLEELGIEDNNWFDPYYMMILSKIPKLRILSLRGCQQLCDFVAYGSMAARFGFKSLEHLDFRFTPITNSDLQCFNSVVNLKVLLLDCPTPKPKEEQNIENANSIKKFNRTSRFPSRLKVSWSPPTNSRSEQQADGENDVDNFSLSVSNVLESLSSPSSPSSSLSSCSSSAASSTSSSSSESLSSFTSSPTTSAATTHSTTMPQFVNAPSILKSLSNDACSVTTITQPTTSETGQPGVITATILDAYPEASTSQAAAALRAITHAAAEAANKSSEAPPPPSTTHCSRVPQSRASKKTKHSDDEESQERPSKRISIKESDEAVASTSAAAAAAAAAAAFAVASDSSDSSSDEREQQRRSQLCSRGERANALQGLGTALQQPTTKPVPESANKMLPAVQNRITIRPDRFIFMDLEDRRRSIIIQSSQARQAAAAAGGPPANDAGAAAAAGGMGGAAGPVGNYNDLENVIHHPLFRNLLNPLGGRHCQPRRSRFNHDAIADIERGCRSRARQRQSISDRGINCFGRPEHPVEPGFIWIRIGNRPSLNSFTRLCIRNYKLVTDVALAHLVQCSPNLTYLDVSGTSVTLKGVLKFRRSKPTCTVIAEHLKYDPESDPNAEPPRDDNGDDSDDEGPADPVPNAPEPDN